MVASDWLLEKVIAFSEQCYSTRKCIKIYKP
jgi:hypothetical protein